MTALSLPLWAIAIIAAFAVVVGALAFVRGGVDGRATPAIVGGAVVVMLVLAGLGLVDHLAARDKAAQRHALDARAFDLATRALAPGSALACLNAVAGEAIEEACDKALFASPEATAAAVSYVTAQLSLLAASHEHGRAGEHSVVAVNLRRALEADRFGIVAYVLAVRDGCTSRQCGAFSLLQDVSRISANLARRTFEARLESHMAGWPATGARPVASNPAGNPQAGMTPPPPAVAATKTPNNLYFPSAASIPPVNIMTAEPMTRPPHDTTGSADAAAAARKPQQGGQQSGPQARPAPATGPAPAAPVPLQLAPAAQ